MRSIEPLTEASRSSMRSGVVICDLTRIIEELTFNSLNAGATKVSVEVGVGSSYVKVEDNGSGISRDGLVLLGERYATSKVDRAWMDTARENFNFHGEALCSISDVSLLEVITKARGKPSGYRKIMKNTKCLFLGINDDRQDAGTTVIVRDIFYNQPVRRKQMESSPKKVLDSIKMSVLRIALVHLNVSFKVVDVESADELLRTGPSSSPLPLLSSSFGIEISATFHKLNLSAGELKLSGYISDPREIFSLKAVQYVYINSRFICKGPIHKLVNELAARFDLLSSLQPATSFHSGKHNKYDMSPTFILNLRCPRSYYDIITSERSRASVEFKDWGPVLTFIENSVMLLWTENISNEDMVDSFKTGKKRFRKQNHQTPLDSSANPKKLHKKYDNIPLEQRVSSFVKPSRKFSEAKMCPTEAGLLSKTDYLSRSCDASLPGCKVKMNKDIRNNASPFSIFPPDQVAYAFSGKEDNISTSALGNIFPMFGDKIGNTSTVIGGVSANCLQFGDDIHVSKDSSRSFLRTCSFERSLLHERKSFARDERLEFGIDDITTRQKWIDYDNSMGDEIDLAICGRGQQCDEAPLFCSSPITRSDIHEMLESPVRDLVESSLAFRDIPPVSSKQIRKCSSSWKSFTSDWSPLAADKTTVVKLLDDDNDADPIHGYSAMGEDEDLKGSNLNTKDDWQQPNCSFMDIHPDCKMEIGDFELRDFGNMFSKPFKRFSETYWSSLPSYGEVSPKNISVPSSDYAPRAEHEHYRNQEMIYNKKKCLNRSHSAPPFHKLKKRYLDLAYSSSVLSATRNFRDIYAALSSTETSDFTCGQLHAETRNLKCSEKPFSQCPLSPMKRSVMDCSFVERPGLEMEPKAIAVQSTGQQKSEQFMNMEPAQSLNLKEIRDSLESGEKWRNCCLQNSVKGGTISDDVKNQDTILDISSDISHFAGDFVVPKSIDRTSLEDAKVLNQVDKKFIAVVARKTLAIIDQHAADERIRLEELRHKVLSGEMRTIKHLDAERDLVLPEIGYQLLQNYAEQVQTWGWICNIHSQDTSSFTKHLDFLHREPTIIKLLAVPCILGVTLSDLDLLEFLQQLSETDGSAAIPPAVNSVLNNKACRGAIMFGDTLLPSECSLIVEELKQTSLCFQCAHGRPTTVPLVNLELLHNKIARIGSHESWHGLRRHRISLQRSADRLKSSLC